MRSYVSLWQLLRYIAHDSRSFKSFGGGRSWTLIDWYDLDLVEVLSAVGSFDAW
jgi:hypothetical protein